MKAKFMGGGPWDGVELEVPVLPNQFVLRMLWPSQQGPPPKGTIDLGKEHETHVYTAREERDVVVNYFYTPNSKTWIDTV